MASKSQITTTAFHEAGHAVAHWHLLDEDSAVDRWVISVEKGDRFSGFFRSDLPFFARMIQPDGTLPMDDEYEKAIEQEVKNDLVGLAAGAVAEAKKTRQSLGGTLLMGGWDDYATMEIRALAFCRQDNRRARQLMDDAIDDARKVVRYNWNQIESLARQLEVKKTIEGREILHAMFADP